MLASTNRPLFCLTSSFCSNRPVFRPAIRLSLASIIVLATVPRQKKAARFWAASFRQLL